MHIKPIANIPKKQMILHANKKRERNEVVSVIFSGRKTVAPERESTDQEPETLKGWDIPFDDIKFDTTKVEHPEWNPWYKNQKYEKITTEKKPSRTTLVPNVRMTKKWPHKNVESFIFQNHVTDNLNQIQHKKKTTKKQEKHNHRTKHKYRCSLRWQLFEPK